MGQSRLPKSQYDEGIPSFAVLNIIGNSVLGDSPLSHFTRGQINNPDPKTTRVAPYSLNIA